MKLLSSIGLLVFLIVLWEMLSRIFALDQSLLPSPIEILGAIVSDIWFLIPAIGYTLSVSLGGLLVSIILSALLVFLMHWFDTVARLLSPLLVLSQSMPTIVLYPLLVFWFGYGLMPKMIVIVLVCFFPISQSLLDGLKSSSVPTKKLILSMGGSRFHVFKFVELPCALRALFSGLKISITYCVMSAVIAEWMGGEDGIGVYMIRVKRSYEYDKLFAAVVLVMVLSISLYAISSFLTRWWLKRYPGV